MKKISSIFLLLVTFLVFSCKEKAENSSNELAEASKSLNLDLDKPADNMTAFIKVRGSLKDGEEIVFYANGKIYGFVDGERDKPLMGFEMYNIGKYIKTGENQYDLLTNEVLLYTDIKTGEVLEKFKNPYTGAIVDVVHVWNSPVNQKTALEGKYGKWGIPHQKFGDDQICMNADIFLKYPSPLPIKDFPESSQSDDYEAAELFQFFFSEKAINDPNQASVPCTISWTRLGPWLPWLKMAQRPGNMVYQGAGYKLMETDYDKMPKVLTEYVMAKHPEYRHAPTEYSSPNETSWTYFKKISTSK